MLSSSAEAPACSIFRAKSIQPCRVIPLRLAMIGTPVAARARRISSRYGSGPTS